MTPVAGQKVKQGQRLLTFDLNDIREHAASAISPMIFTNRTKKSPCKRGIFWFLCIPYHNVSVVKIK
nr:PTS glucose transporter subunit IIA [Bacillus atrophaeus]